MIRASGSKVEFVTDSGEVAAVVDLSMLGQVPEVYKLDVGASPTGMMSIALEYYAAPDAGRVVGRTQASRVGVFIDRIENEPPDHG